MRITSPLRAAALIGLAVVAGLLGVGGTWALWNATAPSGAGAVQSADFRVELNGSLLAAEGTTVAAVPEDPSAALVPGVPVYTTLTVSNGIDAGTPTSVHAVLGVPTVARASAPGLGTALTLRAGAAPAAGGCAAATYSADGTGAAAVVAQGGTARFCLRMSLPADAPTSLAQATATITIPVTVTQQPRGTRP